MLLGVALLTAVLGMYWDISLHIDNGRDAGPLAEPGALPDPDRPLRRARGRRAVDCALRHRAPREDGGAPRRRLVGAGRRPDDGRLRRVRAHGLPARRHVAPDLRPGRDALGPDPPDADRRRVARDARRHGADGRGDHDASAATPSARATPWVYHVRRALLVGGFLVALTTFQAEFDFGVPQFRAVHQPILIMLAAGIGLVTTRLYLGRGGALLAVLGYMLIRGFLAIMVGGVWGQTTPALPALHRRGAARGGRLRARRWPQPGGERRDRRRPDRHDRPCGRVGLVARLDADSVELVAAARGRHRRHHHRRRRRRARWLHRRLAHRPQRRAHQPRGRAPARFGRPPCGAGGRARSDGRDRLGPAHVRERSAARAGHAAGHRPRRAAHRGGHPAAGAARLGQGPRVHERDRWQGGGSVVDPLEKVGPGVYRTTKPIPVYGGWKSTLRIQQGDALISMPLFMPKDEAIPAPEVPAKANFTREFQSDNEVLQRERKQGVSPALTPDRLPHRAGDRAVADRADRVVAAAGRPRRGEALDAPRQDSARRGPNSCERALKLSATSSPKHLIASPPRRVRDSAERGNQVVGGHGHWGEPSREGAQALSARARQLTP